MFTKKLFKKKDYFSPSFNQIKSKKKEKDKMSQNSLKSLVIFGHGLFWLIVFENKKFHYFYKRKHCIAIEIFNFTLSRKKPLYCIGKY